MNKQPSSLLKRKRLTLGMSGHTAAKMIGVTPAAYYKWESKSQTPRAKYYPKIASAFGLTTDQALELIDPQPAA